VTNIPYTLKPDDQLCFIHIGKTAGTSLVATLATFFQEDEICKTYHMSAIRNLSPQQLEKYRFFRGHFTYAITKHLSRNPVLITMLRNPVDRARSLYQHVLKDKNNSRHEAIKDLSLSEFIAADRPIRIEVSNWQTRILTDTLKPDLEPNLELAKRRLRDEFLFFGLTERYKDSLTLLSYTLGWPMIDEIKELNKTPRPITRQEISPELVDQILEINRLDQQLYDYAQELFEERFALMQQDLSEGEIVFQSIEPMPVTPSQPKPREPQQKKPLTKPPHNPLRKFANIPSTPAFVKTNSSKGLSDLTLPDKTYIICANYRSGSTLLARALGHFKGAGKPSEVFSPLLMKGRRGKWEIDEIEYIDYIE